MIGSGPLSESASGNVGTAGVTRLAPSPTGALHLGNARTFLINWLLARRFGWRIVMRIEDLDGPRVKAGAAERALAVLEWLGLGYDEGPHYQSSDLSTYSRAMESLAGAGVAFPSDLSRAEIEEASSAPHEAGGETRFPPELRPEFAPRSFDEPGRSWRFVTPPGPVAFNDRVAGAQAVDPGADVGDFVVWTKRGEPSYQLAVVVDDARQGVNRIVRGDDLVPSTGRQLLLARALGLEFEPEYWHVPLVIGPDGRRLAKRHGDTRVDSYKSLGVAPERVLGLLANWLGVLEDPEPIDLAELTGRFAIDTMSRGRIVFLPEHDAWLRNRGTAR